MAYIKIYVDNAELEEITKCANQTGISLSAYVRIKLGLPADISRFSEILENTIKLAEDSSPGTEFSIPDLYTAINWNSITSEIGAGVLGKRFFESVVSGKVAGVVPMYQKKNRRELYLKK